MAEPTRDDIDIAIAEAERRAKEEGPQAGLDVLAQALLDELNRAEAG